MVSLKINPENIQAKWLIEENAKILRNDVWFNPPIAPTIADRIII